MSVPFKVFENDETPAAVLAAIRSYLDQQPAECERVLLELRYNKTLGCWTFTHAGMFHGVEADGYIHT